MVRLEAFLLFQSALHSLPQRVLLFVDLRVSLWCSWDLLLELQLVKDALVKCALWLAAEVEFLKK